MGGVDWVGESDSPAYPRGRRVLWWGISRSVAVKVAAVVLVAGAVGIGAWMLAPTPAALQVPESVLAGANAPIPRDPGSVGANSAGAAANGGGGAERAGGHVLVHVAGAVEQPGLVELPEGSRLADALEMAAGPSDDADLDAVNLAALAVDGEQVYVPARGEVGSPGGAPAPDAPALIDLNTANAADLEALPGIGPVLAERIASYRTSNGNFASVDDLRQVPGIGPTLLAGVREEATV